VSHATVQVDSLSFTYPGGTRPAVREVSFSIEPGEVFGLLGPSGAGKSTTQSVLIGLLDGWTGSVRVLGKELREWGRAYYREIGVSFEFPNHYLKLTARENLDLFRSLHGADTESVEAVLELVDLADAVDTRVAEFSKGMKQRLTFARSLLHRPTLWFLDEPTAALDPVNARRIMDVVADRQKRGVTVFLTTHDMSVANELCDRVGFIIDGDLSAVDTPKALRHRYGAREVLVTWSDATEAGSARYPLDGLGRDTAFLDALREHRVESIHSQETTLEDVFIQVTGRRLT
jgi:fluoroquinolone transport system ATP-binding protein